MNKVANISGALLGLVFLLFGINFWLKFYSPPPAPEGSAADFMSALYGSGYLAFVKALEVLGGLLTAIPKTRNLGLIILAPIIANIMAYKVFLQQGGSILGPEIIVILVLSVVVAISAAPRFLRNILA